jgi:hypothetical protein
MTICLGCHFVYILGGRLICMNKVTSEVELAFAAERTLAERIKLIKLYIL